MASIGHIIVGGALGHLSTARAQRRDHIVALAFFATVALLPDFDVVAFRFGIPYASFWGHRGISHAIVTAVVFGPLLGLVFLALRGRAGIDERPARVIVGVTLALLSHGILDMLTDGGHGVLALWPLDAARHFLPWQPLPVAPIGLGMLSARGLWCLLVEIVVFAPIAWVAYRWRKNTGADGAANCRPTRT